MNEYDELLLELNQQLWSTMIDFRYNRNTKTYSVVRFNANPSMVLYKDGRARVTSDVEIARQLKELT